MGANKRPASLLMRVTSRAESTNHQPAYSGAVSMTSPGRAGGRASGRPINDGLRCCAPICHRIPPHGFSGILLGILGGFLEDSWRILGVF